MNSAIWESSLHGICTQTSEKYHQHIYNNIWVEIGLGTFLTSSTHGH